jgi:thiamine-phosphate diphosphorylase
LTPVRLPLVYAITDRRASGVEDPGRLAEELINLGIRCVQIREKELSDRALLDAVERARAAATSSHASLLVNDRVDIARCTGVGVHLGEEDLGEAQARKILGPDLPIGVSTHSAHSARRAFERREADYVALGPVFDSPTKEARAALGLDALAEAARDKSRPLVAIGGIGVERLPEVWDAGADSAAMISGLLAGDRVANVRRALDLGRRRWPLSRIYLIGFMGCGKTTIGRRIADRLGWDFLDLDLEVERSSGKSVREIFETEGEGEFRRRESLFLEASGALRRIVVATGGGSFMVPENRRRIQEFGVGVFLDLPWSVILLRLAGKTDRPLFRDAGAAAELYAQRLPSYRMAPVTVRLTGSEHVETAADRIMSQIDDHTCVI